MPDFTIKVDRMQFNFTQKENTNYKGKVCSEHGQTAI